MKYLVLYHEDFLRAENSSYSINSDWYKAPALEASFKKPYRNRILISLLLGFYYVSIIHILYPRYKTLNYYQLLL